MSDLGIQPINSASVSSNSVLSPSNEDNIQKKTVKSNDKDKCYAMKMSI